MDVSKIKELREKTGAGIMECKHALEKTDGDIEKAMVLLHDKARAFAGTRSTRRTSEGTIGAYIHPGGKLGVLVELNCETDFVARTDEFRALVKDIAMQIAATNPVAIDRASLPEELIEKEQKIYQEHAKSMNKPEKAIENIVQGKLEKYFQEVCLLEQPFIKDPHISVDDLIKNHIAKLGENITIKRFMRFQLGEGEQPSPSEVKT